MRNVLHLPFYRVTFRRPDPVNKDTCSQEESTGFRPTVVCICICAVRAKSR